MPSIKYNKINVSTIGNAVNSKNALTGHSDT